ncbi:MAG TPA: hypothetical protein DCL40_02505 [Coxiellaceae bacterium]|nr:hypothetical protein [Coxiellaceae bacterium]
MFFPQKSSQSQHQFNAAVMRSCQGSSGLFVAELENEPMFDDLHQELEGLHGLLMNNNYREYINRSTALVRQIESAEYSFFQEKYTTECPGFRKSQINRMARVAASVSDSQGRLLPMKLASLVQHWTGHPNRFGETRPEFTSSLRQIASVSKQLDSQLETVDQEQFQQPSMPASHP